MLFTAQGTRGALVAPHRLAAQSGLAVLREGGNAIEAMVAAAATISVVYPHMNGLGGDGFWLIQEPGATAPLAITGVGRAGAKVDEAFYRGQGLDAVPNRGPLAANSVAGTVSGWQAALDIGKRWGGQMALPRLLEDAIVYAEGGFPTSEAQHRDSLSKHDELVEVPGWSALFAPGGAVPQPGTLFKQPALAASLRRLAEAGLDDFYRGELARRIAADLVRAGSPLIAEDLAGQEARVGPPLAARLQSASVFNLPPPSQGFAALMILALFDRLGCREAEGFSHVHGLVEATKEAILLRDAHVTDPADMEVEIESFLEDQALAGRAAGIDRLRARPWPFEPLPGDTVWLGAADAAGRVVSFIHSIYWEFGSGVCLEETGIQWQNRGSSFKLDPAAQNHIRPGRLPFHTNNPAMALLDDGRVMVYGAMGGEGQPQSQSAVFSRYALFGQDLQAAVNAPRWVLGRTWGQPRTNLRLESRFALDVVTALAEAGHDVEVVGAYDQVMGHAGALVWRPDGLIEGAADPRSDGVAAVF